MKTGITIPLDIPNVEVLETEITAEQQLIIRVEMTSIPKGWALTFAYRDIPCNWCIFRLLESSPPQHQVDYQLGQSIRLVGYDVDRTRFQAGDTIHLTLHWQAEAPIDRDYTVFTQLLGPDFQLHGQLDNQPINNLWPTSRWQPADRLADTYAIPIDEHAPSGMVQLLVGMYDGQTGKRQTITQNSKSIADDAISLTTIIIEP